MFRRGVLSLAGSGAFTRGTITDGVNPLDGSSLDGTPFDNITPVRILGNARFTNASSRWWAEYGIRTQTEVTRVAETLLDSPFLIAQDLLSLDGFFVQRVGVGLNLSRGRDRTSLVFAVENLTNKFYREQFQFAPARGRSFTVGINIRGVSMNTPWSASFVHYIPILTTILCVVFASEIFSRYREHPERLHLLWWAIGVATYGVGTFTEATTTLMGWNEPVFRAWYISGALLGGAPLAQGTVYLLLRRRTAHILTALLVGYVIVASVFVVLSPINYDLVEAHRLSGRVLSVELGPAVQPGRQSLRRHLPDRRRDPFGACATAAIPRRVTGCTRTC